jgi:hypothetical protein
VHAAANRATMRWDDKFMGVSLLSWVSETAM